MGVKILLSEVLFSFPRSLGRAANVGAEKMGEDKV
jgi:hypothetical protein